MLFSIVAATTYISTNNVQGFPFLYTCPIFIICRLLNDSHSEQIPGSGRSPGEGNVNPLQYYCLENPMDRGAWQAIVHVVAKSQT